MKRFVAVVATVVLWLGFSVAPVEANAPTYREQLSSIFSSAAEQLLYCESPLNFAAYDGAMLFDNNGSCIDISDLVWDSGLDFDVVEQQLNMRYLGGVHRWEVHNGSGKSCPFFTYFGDATRGELLAWETYFVACAVLLNEPVSESWFMTVLGDESETKAVTICPENVEDFRSSHCLSASGSDNNPPTVGYVNDSYKKLSKKFYGKYKGWLRPKRTTNSIDVVMAQYPAGSKIRLQRLNGSKWVTVRSWEVLWDGRKTFTHTKAKKGKYRISAVSVSGLTFTSKSIIL